MEREYLTALNETVSLEDWSKIVAKAVADAIAGDWRGREWLSKYVLGDSPPSLLRIAAVEYGEISVQDEIQLQAKKAKQDRMFDELASFP